MTAALVVGVVLDDFQGQANGGGLATALTLSLAICNPGELQQQAVRIVELGAVVGPGVELLDVGRTEIVGLDGRLQLLEGGLDTAEIEVFVQQQAHGSGNSENGRLAFSVVLRWVR